MFFNLICHFVVHLEPEETDPYQGHGSQIAVKMNFGHEEGGTMPFTIGCISLVANNSVWGHGGNLSIAKVSKRVRALRHLHLRRGQFSTRGKWDGNAPVNGTAMACSGTLPNTSEFFLW